MILDIHLPDEAIKEICTPGDNAEAVEQWCETLDLYSKIERKDAIKFVKEFGSYSLDELDCMQVRELIEFAVWNLAWNIFDNQKERQDGK
jgi:hypothetical protein